MRSQAPTMTRAHFQYLAEWVKFDLAYSPVESEQIPAIARSLAASLASTNGQFDRDRFLKACGVTE